MEKEKSLIYSVSGKFDPMPLFGSLVQEGIMPILGIVDETLIAYGTGFIVAHKGLMMTATHVIQQAWSQRVRKRDENNQSYDHCELFALYVTGNRHESDENTYVGTLVPIVKAWFNQEIDIAYCRLQPMFIDNKEVLFPSVKLTLEIPKIGENIIGIGYYKMSGSRLLEKEKNVFYIDYSQNSAHTAGKVVETFPKRRDSVMLSFPCFQSDARFDPGMSGGPIFNDKGYVCGVICSSMSQVESDHYISYGSLIYPAMSTQIEIFADGKEIKTRSIYELALNGIISIDDTIKNLRILEKSNNQRTISILIPKQDEG